MTTRAALHDRIFWTLVIASLCAMAPGAGMMNHMVAAVVDKGFSQTLAANIASVSMLLGVVWTLGGGFLVDKVNTARINVPFQLLSAFGVLLFSMVTPGFGGVALLFLAYSLQGLGLTAGRPMNTYFQTRFFGLRCFGEISALQSAPLSIAMGLTAPLMGWIYDSTHSYQIAFMIMIAGLLLAAGLFLTLGRYRFAVAPPRTDVAVHAEEIVAAPAGYGEPIDPERLLATG
jgi:MFS family permease